MSKTGEMTKVRRELLKQGFPLEEAEGHWRVYNPNPDPPPGERKFITICSTPRSDSGVRNTIARLRRTFGFVWQGH